MRFCSLFIRNSGFSYQTLVILVGVVRRVVVSRQNRHVPWLVIFIASTVHTDQSGREMSGGTSAPGIFLKILVERPHLKMNEGALCTLFTTHKREDIIRRYSNIHDVVVGNHFQEFEIVHLFERWKAEQEKKEMRIPEYFAGKKILITGATGFMGKALVEKLLRCCPEVSTIYVVIRSKKGSTPEERWAEIVKLPLFDKLKLKCPSALDKIVTIPGESTADRFGISEEHEKMLVENVNIVYHVAASVRFTEELVSALKLNLKSTYSILEMAKKMRHLECFVHTSTAYSNVEKIGTQVEERVYESPLDWRLMLELAENPVYHDLLPSLQPKIMSGHETTYTLTKRIAEALVEEYSQYFPVVMMRPALVISTAEDPIPGWLDAHNALTLVADAIRCGIVRVINFDSEKCLHFITLDLSIKAFLIATWNVHEKQMKKGVDVYCTSMGGGGDGISMNWGDIRKHGYQVCDDYPAVRQIWHPFCIQVRNPYVLGFLFFFLQVVPALLGDFFNRARGVKPQFFYLTTKFYKALTGPLRGFVGRNFHFSRVNYRNLDGLLTVADREAFSIDQSKYNVLELYKTNALGMMKYVLHEDLSPEALKKRRKRSQMYKILHSSVTAALIATCCYVVLTVTPLSKIMRTSL